MKGASGNPQGRLPKQVEQTYLQVCEGVCSFDVWREITMKAVEQAKRGDARARQWLSDYLIGKPLQMVMAVQNKQDTEITVKLIRDGIVKKLGDMVGENSNNPVTVTWDDVN